MSRASRYIETNGFYHIISRSLNETRVMRDASDFCHFIQLMYVAKQKYPISLFHYCLMHTHFHLTVQAPCHKALSQNISYLKWHYTLWSRRKYGWKGPLWRERYKSLLIENADYLYSCGMYIEYNPVRAGICNNPADYKYSSYRKYHLGACDSLVDDYAAGIDLSASLQLDYQSDLAKVIFSLSPAIGSRAFIKRSQNACPQK